MSQAVAAEPRRFGRDARGGFRLFRIGGVQVRVDPSWFLIFLLIWWSLSAGYFPRLHPDAGGLEIWSAGLVTAVLFFVSLLFHELSHAFVARAAGLEVPSITLFLFGGASEMTREPDDPGTELRVAAVGPLASFALALVFFLLARALPDATPALVLGVLGYLAWINFALGIFNLLPGFPLDGGRILRAVLWRRTGSLQRASRVATQAGKGLGMGLAILGGIQIFSGALVGGVWLVLIGLYARGLAETSYQSLLMRQLLAQVSVGEVMVRDPVSVPVDLTLDRLIEDYILGRGFRAFPVVDANGRTLGLVSLESIKSVPPEERARHRVRDHLEPLDPERAVTPDTPLVDALTSLSRLGVRRLPVVRRGSNEVVGLLTTGGLARFVELRRGLANAEPASSSDALIAATR